MKVDMSREAVTGRMRELNQLWELTVALRSTDLKNAKRVEKSEMRKELTPKSRKRIPEKRRP